MKTAVGNPEEFENNKPDKKFQRQLPGEGYKKRPNPPESIHIEVPKPPRVKPAKEEAKQKPRSTQFYTSVTRAKNFHENNPYREWKH